MPVFGIVQEHPITGVIVCVRVRSSVARPLTSSQDEILLKSIPDPEAVEGYRNKRARTSTPWTPKKSARQQDSSSTRCFFASPSKAKSRESASPHRNMAHELSLIDTKTRRSDSLPSDDDAFSSRMQLMLYHHLLSALLSPTFSFSEFWEKVQVDPYAQFSDAIPVQTVLVGQTDMDMLTYAECLDDLTDLWHSTVRSLQVRGVSPTLEIVYRTQEECSTAPQPSGDSRQTRLTDGFGNVVDQEAHDLAHAIEASRRESEDDPELQRALAESLRDAVPRKGSGAELTDIKISDENTQIQSRRVTEQLRDKPHPWFAQSVARDRQTRERSTAEVGTRAGKRKETLRENLGVIGRKSFAFDEAVLHAYVQDVLQWWRGERPPRGVDLEHTRRCS
jgi:exonuclease V